MKLKQYYYFHAEFLEEVRYLENYNYNSISFDVPCEQ